MFFHTITEGFLSFLFNFSIFLWRQDYSCRFFVSSKSNLILFFHILNLGAKPNKNERRVNMAKNRKYIWILVAAIVVAVIGGVSLYLFLVPQKTTVYVFNDNYKAGEALSEEMLTPIQADSKIVVAGKKADTSSRFITGTDISAVLNAGDSLRMDVSEGMPLTLSILSVTGGSTVEMNMDPSKVAVTIPVTNITGVTNDLKEGSRVNIYTTGGDTMGTTLLFQNMRVLSVNRDSSGIMNSATIEVTVDESLKLIYAANYSAIYLGLVDSTGYEFTEESMPSYAPAAHAGN